MSALARIEPGSFRDPGGRVYLRDERILRAVMPSAAPAFEMAEQAGVLRRLSDAGKLVEEGSSLYRALDQTGQFPPLMLHMIASGETAGELDTMLARVSENQQQELDNLVETFVSLFEPATLLIMGGVVLVIVVAILQPILTMNQLI